MNIKLSLINIGRENVRVFLKLLFGAPEVFGGKAPNNGLDLIEFSWPTISSRLVERHLFTKV